MDSHHNVILLGPERLVVRACCTPWTKCSAAKEALLCSLCSKLCMRFAAAPRNLSSRSSSLSRLQMWQMCLPSGELYFSSCSRLICFSYCGYTTCVKAPCSKDQALSSTAHSGCLMTANHQSSSMSRAPDEFRSIITPARGQHACDPVDHCMTVTGMNVTTIRQQDCLRTRRCSVDRGPWTRFCVQVVGDLGNWMKCACVGHIREPGILLGHCHEFVLLLCAHASILHKHLHQI